MASKVIKMCDLPIEIAEKVFEAINYGMVKVFEDEFGDHMLITDCEPKDLIYPEGWYYAKGNFRNKHTSSTGLYQETIMLNSDFEEWHNKAKYCTLR